jgi:L-rhamnose-H+ transport protein
MIPVTSDPMLGVSFHAVGATFAANCYAPQKYLRRWSWEIFWMTQAAWCWLLWPIIGAMLTVPDFWHVLRIAPKLPMLYCALMGVAYGVGGTAFNISIRYIGFSLTYAIAVGLSSVLGTLVTPLWQGRIGETFDKQGGGWVLLGIAVGVLGIALCGLAGRFKEGDLRDQEGATEFSWIKGLTLSLVAGVLSAVYGIAINDVAKPIIAVAEECGAGYWQGNVAYVFVNPGAFLTALGYSLYLARKNRSLGELTALPSGAPRGALATNYLLAFLTGTLWYGQFFFYNLGHVRLGPYQFSSWAIHMIMLVLFSNVTAVLFHEWKGCRQRTQTAIAFALSVLVSAVLMLTYGNYLGDQVQPAGEPAAVAANVGTGDGE